MDITCTDNCTVNPKDPYQRLIPKHFAQKHAYSEKQLEAVLTNFEAFKLDKLAPESITDELVREGVCAFNEATARMWSEATRGMSTKTKIDIFNMYSRCSNFISSVKMMESVVQKMVKLDLESDANIYSSSILKDDDHDNTRMW